MRISLLLALSGLVACGGESPSDSDAGVDAGTESFAGFAERVESFTPGANGGFGQDKLPDVVLGAPRGKGDKAGSLHVVSLGRLGEIVLAIDELELVDGEGADLLVFENAFKGFIETGFVAASVDGQTWHEWPCAPEDEAGGYPGCAGVTPVFASIDNDIEPQDPSAAGGDAFDLAELGLTFARFIRIRDSGFNVYEGTSGGFDLDAVALVHSRPVTP